MFLIKPPAPSPFVDVVLFLGGMSCLRDLRIFESIFKFGTIPYPEATGELTSNQTSP
jgi:hypothetical protein